MAIEGLIAAFSGVEMLGHLALRSATEFVSDGSDSLPPGRVAVSFSAPGQGAVWSPPLAGGAGLALPPGRVSWRLC